ncbi:MAG: hypothetical protein EAY65_03870 [Alphaproteobacteria bacterium]|nr:MAG: hypothetical protein EAY65_03870 [Alphaproteobacteria bacterium]
MGALMSMMVLCSGCGVFLPCLHFFPSTAEVSMPPSWTNEDFITLSKDVVTQRSHQLFGQDECLPSSSCSSESGWWNGIRITAYNSTDGFLEINDYGNTTAVGYNVRIERINDSTVKISFYGQGPYCAEWGEKEELKIFKDLFLKAIDKHHNAVIPAEAGIQKNREHTH